MYLKPIHPYGTFQICETCGGVATFVNQVDDSEHNEFICRRCLNKAIKLAYKELKEMKERMKS